MIVFLLPLICCTDIFVNNIKAQNPMKSSEFHRLIKKNGWKYIKAEGSHYIYEKEGQMYPVPFHGAKELGKGLENKIRKEMKLK